MSDYLREHFVLYPDDHKDYYGNISTDAGKLKNNTIISQLLVSENREYKEKFIKNNLIDNVDGLAEISRINNYKKCPNIYPVSVHEEFSEKFIETNTIKVSSDENEANSLTITANDIKNLKNPKTNGAYGAIYFLGDQDLECDVCSVDKNEKLKEKFVIKKQSRQFEMGANVLGKDKCLGFNELVNFQKLKLGMSWFGTDAYSDLYINHFYASTDEDPEIFDLFIVMKRCGLILTDLIKIID